MSNSWTRRHFIGTAAAGIAAGTAMAGEAPPAVAPPNPARDAANVEKDIVFGKGADLDLKLDIYKPTGGVAAKRTAIIYLHGGGWGGGDKSGMANHAQAHSALGYVGIGAQYRLSGVARWPAQLEDVKTAIRWTRANASRLNIDPARIVLAGYSAGAYLALFASGTQNEPRYEGKGGNAGVPTAVAACLSYFAPTGTATGPLFRQALPLPPGSSEEAWQEVEIEKHVKGMAPTAVFQGLTDTLVPPEVSETLFRQLRAANVTCELHQFAGVSHEFVTIPEFDSLCATLDDSFVDRHVVNPRTFAGFGGGGAGGGRRGGGAPGAPGGRGG